MKKTTFSKFSKKLAKYGALTAAIAGVADASGQIVYTDVTPDFEGTSGDEFFIDLNQDAINDFKLNIIASLPHLKIDPLTTSNSVLGSSSGSYAYPFALSSGAVISAGQTDWNNQGYSSSSYNYLNLVNIDGDCVAGNWCSETDKFLGLRFTVAGNTHYGWARLDTEYTTSGWTIKDFAYNQTADESIMAGEGTLGIETSELNAVKIVTFNKTIGIYDLKEAANYTLFDISGKKVLAGEITTNTSNIDASGVSTGIYILELKGIESKAVIRKKVIL